MMNALDILLDVEIPKPQTATVKQKRLSQISGKDVLLVLRELSYSRVAEIKEEDEMAVHIILAGTVEPDFKNKELLAKYGAVTPAELIKKLLLPGEIEDLSRRIERLSGYRIDTLEEIEKK